MKLTPLPTPTSTGDEGETGKEGEGDGLISAPMEYDCLIPESECAEYVKNFGLKSDQPKSKRIDHTTISCWHFFD